MIPELEPLRMYMRTMWVRLQIIREDESGMTTETVIITAALVAAAVAALAIISTRIRSETSDIEGG